MFSYIHRRIKAEGNFDDDLPESTSVVLLGAMNDIPNLV
jgi:hypothetical protein